MAAKALQARVVGSQLVAEVWLDTTKTVDDLTVTNPDLTHPQVPDPDWIETWRFGITPPAGLTQAQWLATIRIELRALVAAELARRNPAAGATAAWEGSAP